MRTSDDYKDICQQMPSTDLSGFVLKDLVGYRKNAAQRDKDQDTLRAALIGYGEHRLLNMSKNEFKEAAERFVQDVRDPNNRAVLADMFAGFYSVLLKFHSFPVDAVDLHKDQDGGP